MNFVDIQFVRCDVLFNKISTHLHKIKNKISIIGAEKDRVASKVSSEQLHQGIPKSTLKVYNKGEGNFINLEKAPKVNKIIIEFLEN